MDDPSQDEDKGIDDTEDAVSCEYGPGEAIASGTDDDAPTTSPGWFETGRNVGGVLGACFPPNRQVLWEIEKEATGGVPDGQSDSDTDAAGSTEAPDTATSETAGGEGPVQSDEGNAESLAPGCFKAGGMMLGIFMGGAAFFILPAFPALFTPLGLLVIIGFPSGLLGPFRVHYDTSLVIGWSLYAVVFSMGIAVRGKPWFGKFLIAFSLLVLFNMCGCASFLTQLPPGHPLTHRSITRLPDRSRGPGSLPGAPRTGPANGARRAVGNEATESSGPAIARGVLDRANQRTGSRPRSWVA